MTALRSQLRDWLVVTAVAVAAVVAHGVVDGLRADLAVTVDTAGRVVVVEEAP